MKGEDYYTMDEMAAAKYSSKIADDLRALRLALMTLFGNQCLCVSADDYDALRAENAELKRDADRWRFYREGYSNPAEAEANVDAAMEAATQPTDKP